jgi:hypothetical protein
VWLLREAGLLRTGGQVLRPRAGLLREGLLRVEVLLQEAVSRLVLRPERLRLQHVLRDLRPGESLLPGTRLLREARLL